MKEEIKAVDDNFVILGEDDLPYNLNHIVRPTLEKYRKTGNFQSFDETHIYYECFINPMEKNKIVISHGFCEFARKMEEVIFYFFQAGYSVYLPEHRGHGYSDRKVADKSKIYVKAYEEYVEDFHRFLFDIVLRDGVHKKPVLYAHSMGGAIAALYLEQHPNVFSCAVLSSPMFEMNFGIVPASLIRVIVLILKLVHSEEDYVPTHGAFDGLKQFETSSCLSKARYENMFTYRVKDENYRTYGATYAWALASLKATRKLMKNAEKVTTPTLLFQAGKDSTVRPGGHRKFVKRSKNSRLIVIPESKHEIYNADTKILKDYYRNIFNFYDEMSK